MDAAEFRSLALSLPEAVEAAHMGHSDLRIGKKIFASLGPDGDWAMVKLTPEQQWSFVRGERRVFAPASGAWGRGGATIIQLANADVAAVREALLTAWRNLAPKRLESNED